MSAGRVGAVRWAAPGFPEVGKECRLSISPEAAIEQTGWRPAPVRKIGGVPKPRLLRVAVNGAASGREPPQLWAYSHRFHQPG